jgi:hypothetical protein
MQDQSLLRNVEAVLRPYGLDLLIAEHNYELKFTISDKIRNLINSCDIALVLLTENGFNSGFVREEIGHLDAKGKPIILVIQSGFEKEYSGFKFGHDYILLDPLNPTLTLDKIKVLMLSHWQSIQEEDYKLRQLEAAEQARINRNALIAIGILGGLIILSANE